MNVEWGYALALVIAGLIAAGVATSNWPRRSFRAGRALLAFLLFLSWWSFAYALFWLRIPGPTPFFWIDLTYLSVAVVPIALFIFTLQFTGRGRHLTRLNRVLLLIVPVLTLALLWTDPLHGLFFAGKRVAGQGVIFGGGLGFYLNLVFGYGLILVSIVLLVQGFIRSSGLYRSQILAVLVGILIPIVVNVLSLLGASPFPNLDLTPITFTITGIIFAYALFRLGLLDVVPIARHALVEQMSDGLIVLDAQERVVDFNPAAKTILELGIDPIGQTGAKVLSAWPQLESFLLQMRPASQELLLGGTPQRTAEVFITPLYDQADEFEGRLIVIRDITQRVEVERQLREQIAQTEALQAQLREQSIRDPLTGVFNRRYLEESLHRELANAARKGEPLSVVMLDIDLFKNFNDTYGHALGDLVLQTVGRILNENTRAGDIVCRYGGDEFVVVLPGATAETARSRIDECRRRFAEEVFQVQGKSLHSTLSAGVTIYPEHADAVSTLLDCADRALYQAKQQGKNLTIVLNPAG